MRNRPGFVESLRRCDRYRSSVLFGPVEAHCRPRMVQDLDREDRPGRLGRFDLLRRPGHQLVIEPPRLLIVCAGLYLLPAHPDETAVPLGTP